MSKRESVGRTFVIAGVLSVICAIVVSGAAVSLKPLQNENREKDMKKNILAAAGLWEEGIDIKAAFEEKVEPKLIRLDTGEYSEEFDPIAFDFRKAVKDTNLSNAIPSDKDIAKIKRRANLMTVYEVIEDGVLKKIVLPIYGKGLWSTLYGFIALEANVSTIVGLGFYEHAETPGLGGEVDNPKWKGQFPGKEAFSPEGKFVLTVLKGKVDPQSSEAVHQIDGLSGATITTVGVRDLLKFWFGEEGYGPYLEIMRRKGDLNG